MYTSPLLAYLVSGMVVIGGPRAWNTQLPYVWLLHGAPPWPIILPKPRIRLPAL
jgi:hypothetical protein